MQRTFRKLMSLFEDSDVAAATAKSSISCFVSQILI